MGVTIEQRVRDRLVLKDEQSILKFLADYTFALIDFNNAHRNRTYDAEHAIGWISSYLIKHYGYRHAKK